MVEADDRVQHDLLQRRRAFERSQGRACRNDEDVRIAQQLDGLVRAGYHRKRPERQVEVAALDHLEEVALVLRLAEDDLDVRVTLGEAAQQAGDDLRADALERPDAEAPGVAGLERRHVRLGGEKPCLDGVRVTEEDLPGFRERDRAGAARALDETEADDAFERRDLLGDGRLGVAETLCRAAERPFVRDGLERDQMAKI